MPPEKKEKLKRLFYRGALISTLLLTLVALLMTRPWSRHNSWKQMAIFMPSKRVANFRAMDEIFPSRPIRRGEPSHRFETRERPLPKTYTYRGKQTRLDDFLDRTFTTGVLVLQGNAIVAERYFRGARPDSALTSWSMAKSIVSLLVGIARDEGLIGDLDVPIGSYASELRASAYGAVTLGDALTMSSGVAFDERYERLFSDINLMFARIFYFRESAAHYLASLPREAPSGKRFHYISADTFALGLALREAIGRSLSSYLEQKIWKPIGMEYDASWNVASDDDIELAFCCLNARLRDYAKLGRLVARGGDWDGRRIISKNWLRQSTRVEPERAPGTIPGFRFGYQYHWWIPSGGREAFMAAGIWSQYLYINPSRDLVIVKTSVDPNFFQTKDEHVAVFEAIEDALR
ncbi:MAG: serine hydrolase [Deltaproteobacteria bacterium]|nr:serine hydrolase [Deltaproteobacteria bacterium]